MGVGRCVTRCPGERGLPTATASTQQDMTRLQWTNRQGLFAYITPCLLLLLLLLGPRVECQRLREDLCYCYCNATGAMRSPDGFPTVEGQVTKSTGRPSSPPDVGPTHGTPGGIPRNPFAYVDDQGNTCRIDLAFLLDSSRSVTADNWGKMLQFVQVFAERIEFGLDRTRIGVVTYGDKASLDVKLNDYRSLGVFRQAVRDLPYLGQSAHTAEALRLMRTDLFTPLAGDRGNVVNIAVVMTGGESIINREQTIPEAEQAREQGIIVFTVGIGDELRQSELRGIANDPESQFLYNVQGFDTLINRVDDILSAVCQVSTCLRNDIAFVLDSSGSIGSTNWDKVTTFVGEFVNNIAIGPEANQVGIVTYSSQAELNMRLDEHATRGALMNTVNALPWKNHRTNTSGGIRVMRQGVFNDQTGDRRDAPNIAIVMTDGYSNIDAALTSVEADTARRESIRLFAIGVGDLVEMTEIAAIANDPGYYYEFLLRTFDDLVLYTRRIYDTICSPQEPASSLDFSRCRADMAFVLDGSRSVGSQNWQRIIAFLKDFAQRLSIGPSDNQIGIVTFGNEATLNIRLNQYRSTESFVAAMDNLRYKEEESNTAAGLRVAREQLFTSANGDRPEAPNIAIVITDGESTVDRGSTVPEADAARDAGITVFAIGVGSNVNQNELESIANKPRENFVYRTSDFDDLVNNYEKVLGTTCYVVATQVLECTFEDEDDRLCGMTQEETDQFDWSVQSGPTPSLYTGPDSASAGLYYAYIETSNPRREGDQAKLLLPITTQTPGTYCLRFHCHMFGFHNGALQIFVRRAGYDVTRWTTYGQHGNEWKDKLVDLRLHPGDRVGIRATRGNGYAGDIAIDNLRVTEGSCPF